jgi:hypothetical protein
MAITRSYSTQKQPPQGIQKRRWAREPITETEAAPPAEEPEPGAAKTVIPAETVEPRLDEQSSVANVTLDEGKEFENPETEGGRWWIDGWLITIGESGIAIKEEASKPDDAEQRDALSAVARGMNTELLIAVAKMTEPPPVPEEKEPEEEEQVTEVTEDTPAGEAMTRLESETED